MCACVFLFTYRLPQTYRFPTFYIYFAVAINQYAIRKSATWQLKSPHGWPRRIDEGQRSDNSHESSA